MASNIRSRQPALAILAFAFLVCVTGIAAAQTAAQAPAQSAPQQTTATYEDWIVRCETLQGPPVQKTCEMVQYTQVKGQQGVLTQVAIGRPLKGQPVKMVVQVPVGVWLPTGVTLTTGSKDPGISATFKRCATAGCFADTDVRDDTIRKLRALTDQGHIDFKDGAQKDVSLPVSFKGFGAAYDALSKE
jgi:invasion protein IalB